LSHRIHIMYVKIGITLLFVMLSLSSFIVIAQGQLYEQFAYSCRYAPDLFVQTTRVLYETDPNLLIQILDYEYHYSPDTIICVTEVLLNRDPILMVNITQLLLDRRPDLLIGVTQLLVERRPDLAIRLTEVVLDISPRLALDINYLLLVRAPDLIITIDRLILRESPGILIQTLRLTLDTRPDMIPPLVRLLLDRAPDLVVAQTALVLSAAPDLLVPLTNLLLDRAPNLAVEQTQVLLRMNPQLLPQILSYLLDKAPDLVIKQTNITLTLAPQVIPPLIRYLLRNAPNLVVMQANLTLRLAPSLVPRLLDYLLDNAADVALEQANVTLALAPSLIVSTTDYLLNNAPDTVVKQFAVILRLAPNLLINTTYYLLKQAPMLVVESNALLYNKTPQLLAKVSDYILEHEPRLIAEVANATLKVNPSLLIPQTEYLVNNDPQFILNQTKLLASEYPDLFIRVSDYLGLTETINYSRPALVIASFDLMVRFNRPDVLDSVVRTYLDREPVSLYASFQFMRDKRPNLWLSVMDSLAQYDPQLLARTMGALSLDKPFMTTQLFLIGMEEDSPVVMEVINITTNISPNTLNNVFRAILGVGGLVSFYANPEVIDYIMNKSLTWPGLTVKMLDMLEKDVAIGVVYSLNPNVLTNVVNSIDKASLIRLLDKVSADPQALSRIIESLGEDRLNDIYAALPTSMIARIGEALYGVDPELLSRIHVSLNNDLLLKALNTYFSLNPGLFVDSLTLALDHGYFKRTYDLILGNPAMVLQLYRGLSRNYVTRVSEVLLDDPKALVTTEEALMNDPDLLMRIHEIMGPRLSAKMLDMILNLDKYNIARGIITAYLQHDPDLLISTMSLLEDTHIADLLARLSHDDPKVAIRINEIMSDEAIADLTRRLINTNPEVLLMILGVITNGGKVDLALHDLVVYTRTGDLSLMRLLVTDESLAVTIINYSIVSKPGDLVELVKSSMRDRSLFVALIRITINSGMARSMYGAIVSKDLGVAIGIAWELLLTQPGLLLRMITS